MDDKFVLITTDDDVEEVVCEDSPFNQVISLLGGNMFCTRRCTLEGFDSLTLYIDEQGAANGFPPNRIAMALIGNQAPIAGDVIVACKSVTLEPQPIPSKIKQKLLKVVDGIKNSK